jgi:hypothetical protein
VAMLEKYEINERPPGFLLIGTDFGRLLLADTAKDESTLKVIDFFLIFMKL